MVFSSAIIYFSTGRDFNSSKWKWSFVIFFFRSVTTFSFEKPRQFVYSSTVNYFFFLPLHRTCVSCILLVLISCSANSHYLPNVKPIKSGMTTASKSKRGSRSTGCISATLYRYPVSAQSSVLLLVCRRCNITLEHVQISTSSLPLVWWLQIEEVRCVVCE